MTDFAQIKGVQEIFREIDIKELMNKKNVQDFNKVENLRIPRSEKIGLDKAPVALRNLMEVSDICDFQSRC